MSRGPAVGWLPWVNFEQMYMYECEQRAFGPGKSGEKSDVVDASSHGVGRRVDVKMAVDWRKNGNVVLLRWILSASEWIDCLIVWFAVIVQIV